MPPGALELRELERLLAAQDWQTVRQKAKQLIDITLEGLGYLQRYVVLLNFIEVRCDPNLLTLSYDRYVLRFIVTAGYVGWMIFSALHVPHTHVVPPRPSKTSTIPQATGLSPLDFPTLTMLATMAGVFAYQRSPWTYYLYAAFPIYFLRSIVKEGNALYEVLERRMDWGTFPTPEQTLGWGVGIFAVMECMVVRLVY